MRNAKSLISFALASATTLFTLSYSPKAGAANFEFFGSAIGENDWAGESFSFSGSFAFDDNDFDDDIIEADELTRFSFELNGSPALDTYLGARFPSEFDFSSPVSFEFARPAFFSSFPELESNLLRFRFQEGRSGDRGGVRIFDGFSDVVVSGPNIPGFYSFLNTNALSRNGNFVSTSFSVLEQENTDAIPTPALLPGLIGMGLAAIRKRNRAEAD